MHIEKTWTRRRFLSGAAAGGGILLTGYGGSALAMAGKQASTRPSYETTAGEDLMREHGVLRRLLLIYEEGIRRIDAGQELPSGMVKNSAGIIHTFIENYHEKLEEDYLMPKFASAGVLAELAGMLCAQHDSGRAMTSEILRLAGEGVPKNAADRARLTKVMRQYIRMYQPHSAREDTVLFPAIRRVYSPKEYVDLGKTFENKEHELFGERGFEKTVDRVAAIEKTLGIHDISQFTPKT